MKKQMARVALMGQVNLEMSESGVIGRRPTGKQATLMCLIAGKGGQVTTV